MKVIVAILLFIVVCTASLPAAPAGYSLWAGQSLVGLSIIVYYPTTNQYLTTGTLPLGLDPPGILFGTSYKVFTLAGASSWSGDGYSGYQGALTDPSGNVYSGTYSGNYCCTNGGGCQELGDFNVAFGATSAGAPYVYAFYSQVGGGAIYYLPNIPINGVNAPDLSLSTPSAPYVLYVSALASGYTPWAGQSLAGRSLIVYYPTTNQYLTTGTLPLGLDPPGILFGSSYKVFTLAGASSWSGDGYSGYQGALTDPSGNVYSGTYSGNYCCTNGGGCQELGDFNVAFALSGGGAGHVYAFYTQVGGGAIYYLPNIPINGVNAPDLSLSAPSAPYVLYVL